MAAVSFHCICRDTKPGENVFVVGSHDMLGNWNVSRAVPMQTDPKKWPQWKSYELKIEDVSLLEYKHIIKRGDECISWEPIAGNRKITLTRGMHCFVENNWGSTEATTLSLQPLIDEPVSFYEAPFSAAPPGTYIASNGVNHHDHHPSHDHAPANMRSGSPPESPRRHTIARSAFILANTGSMHRFYRVVGKVGQGTWGSVHEVVDKSTGVVRAAKKVPKSFVEDIDRFRQVRLHV